MKQKLRIVKNVLKYGDTFEKSVLTIPPGLTLRTPVESFRYKLPAESHIMFVVLISPKSAQGPVPATVVTVPFKATFRIVEFVPLKVPLIRPSTTNNPP